MMTLGMYMMASPIVELSSQVPYVGDFVSTVVSYAFIFLAMILSTIFTIIVIAIAWLFYRPLIGLSILAALGLVITIILYMVKKEIQQAAQ